MTLSFAVLIHNTTGQELQGDLGFGKECLHNSTNATETCNDLKHLICNTLRNNVSVCGCKEDMYYDRGMSECVRVAGQNCSETSKCITNSSCTTNNICVCNDPYIPNSVGACSLSHNDRCGAPEECSDRAFLTCRRTRCVCNNEETQLWNSNEKTCKTRLGASCRNSSIPCVPNAACNIISSTCECEENFVADFNRCAVAYGGTCTNDTECSSGFICNNATKCDCDTPTQMYEDGMCVVTVESSCEENKRCVKGSYCNDEKICICNSPHYIPTLPDNKTCSPVLGGDCDPDADEDICETSFPEYSLECNPLSHKCHCKDHYKPNADGKCRGLLNANCNETFSLCVDYAECSNENKCSCKSDYTASPTGDECLLKYDMNCEIVDTSSLKCNNYEFLTCLNNKCMCENPENVTYQASTQKCVAFADSLCMTKVFNFKQLTCIENSTCTAVEGAIGSLDGICRCNENFMAEDSKRCIPTPNSSYSIKSSIGILLLVFVASNAITIIS